MSVSVLIFALVMSAQEMGEKTCGGPIKGGGWNIWTNGSVSQWLLFPRTGTYRVVVLASGQPAAGRKPVMTLSVDLGEVKRWQVGQGWKKYEATVMVKAGRHLLSVSFVNDYSGPEGDRNLLLRSVEVGGGPGEVKKADAPDWRKEAEERIERSRKGEIVIEVVEEKGRPVPGAGVKVE